MSQALRRSIPRASTFLTLLAIVFSMSFAGCPCISGAVNASPELRWFLFSKFGASKLCPEMLKHGVSIRLEQRSAAIGRFFPMQCTFEIDNQRQTITVNVSGTGYGYMPPAKRVGFSLTTSVEYRPDFQIAGDDVYVWARMNRIVQGPDFKLGYVENPIVDVLGNLPPFGSLANFFGQQVVTAAMTQGFTVIHNDEGNDFTLGILFPPAKPHHPFQVVAAEKFTYANETIDVHQDQRDYLGPFEVPSGQSLHLTLSLQGQPVDVMIVDKQTGDAWRDAYQTGKPLGPPPGPVVAGAPLYPGPTDNRTHKLPPGEYYVVIDNTSAAGTVNPPITSILPFADANAHLSYVVQLVE